MPQQKTFWHLLAQRRVPTEYEIATSKLLLNTGEGFTGKGFELDVPLREWYEQYQQGSPLNCRTWERFRDPRETTYTKYTELQMKKEIVVDGILEEIEATDYDRAVSAQWLGVLEALVAPFRYPGHAFMMIAAYIAQMAPGGRIAVAATFQAGDEARRVERLAYRIRQLQSTFPGFAAESKSHWERGPCWQPLRECVERVLVTYDWGEAFVALNLVLKPMVDELFMKHTSDLALGHNDHLLGRVFYSLNEDCRWHREWSRALVQAALEENPSNIDVIQSWIGKWRPLAVQAIEALSPLFEGSPCGTGEITCHELASQVAAFSDEYLRTLKLERMKPFEDQLQTIIDTIPVVAWSMLPDGSIDFFNQQWTKYTGLAAEEALNWGWKVAKHPDDLPRILDVFERATESGEPFEVEGRIRRSDGVFRWFLIRGNPLRDQFGAIVRWYGTDIDIEDRRSAEQRLTLQHTVTQTLAAAATLEEVVPKVLQTVCEFLRWDLGALWSMDREAGVLRCVEVWHRESVAAPEFEAVSRESTFLPGVGLPGRIWSSLEPVYISDVVDDTNFSRAAMAAREGLHSALGFPILLGGDVVGVMEFFSHEIQQPEQELLKTMATLGSQIGQFIEGKRAEERLHKKEAELAHVTRVATLGEMTTSIAHEINQPLGAVVNNASACLRWLSAQNLEEARRSATLVIANGHRASEIIGRIRALAQKAPTRKDWLDVNETVREVIALAYHETQRNGISVRASLAADVPLIVADRIQLQQVVLNLMMNAIEALNGGGQGPREILVRSGGDGSHNVRISVEDFGPGLDPKSLDHVFDAFYTTKPHGLGMGLAISRSIVEAHGGRLWAAADVAHGAIFHFTLPIDSEKGP